MTPEDRAEFGIEGDWPVGRRHRIRWSECDALGHANNVAYLTLCEDLRVGPGWSALGGTFAPGAVSPVVAQMEARYLKSLVFEDEGHGISKPANQKRLFLRLAEFFGKAFAGAAAPLTQIKAPLS